MSQSRNLMTKRRRQRKVISQIQQIKLIPLILVEFFNVRIVSADRSKSGTNDVEVNASANHSVQKTTDVKASTKVNDKVDS